MTKKHIAYYDDVKDYAVSLCGIEQPRLFVDKTHAIEYGVGNINNVCITCQKILRSIDQANSCRESTGECQHSKGVEEKWVNGEPYCDVCIECGEEVWPS